MKDEIWEILSMDQAYSQPQTHWKDIFEGRLCYIFQHYIIYVIMYYYIYFVIYIYYITYITYHIIYFVI